MEQNNRKATDILVSLESKIDMVINMYRAQELNLKILSNKVNVLIDHLSKQPAVIEAPKFKIEASDIVPNFNNPKNIKISAENNIPIASDSIAGRRGDRSDAQPTSREEAIKAAVNQINKASKPKEAVADETQDFKEHVAQTDAQNKSYQIIQRIVDKNHKSIFLAEVEVSSLENGNIIHRTRTNGVGKWMGSLPIGNYRVTVRKQGAAGKQKMEAIQDIKVDGKHSTLELSELIVK